MANHDRAIRKQHVEETSNISLQENEACRSHWRSRLSSQRKPQPRASGSTPVIASGGSSRFDKSMKAMGSINGGHGAVATTPSFAWTPGWGDAQE
eukprot:2591373-Amphidinium_carterae.1